MLFIPMNILVGKPLHRKIIEMLQVSVTVSTGSTGRDLCAQKAMPSALTIMVLMS